MGALHRPFFVWGYFRFRWPALAATSIHLELYAESVADWDASQHALAILAEQIADAPAVDGADDRPDAAAGRTVTQGSVRWPASGGLDWQLGRYVRSPDLLPIFAELPSLTLGAYVQLWLRSELAGPMAELGTVDWSVDETRAARLVFVRCP